MKIFSITALGALMIICPPQRCNGCLDLLLKSFFEVFNPIVEIGPGRLTERHRYSDGFMPDYPVPNVHAYRNRRTSHDEAPSADNVDDGCGGPEYPIRLPAVGGIRKSSPTIVNSGYVPGDQPLTDFIVSLLETAQLTSRAALKKSKGKADESFAATARTTTTTRQKRFLVLPSPSESIVPL